MNHKVLTILVVIKRVEDGATGYSNLPWGQPLGVKTVGRPREGPITLLISTAPARASGSEPGLQEGKAQGMCPLASNLQSCGPKSLGSKPFTTGVSTIQSLHNNQDQHNFLDHTVTWKSKTENVARPWRDVLSPRSCKTCRRNTREKIFIQEIHKACCRNQKRPLFPKYMQLA